MTEPEFDAKVEGKLAEAVSLVETWRMDSAVTKMDAITAQLKAPPLPAGAIRERRFESLRRSLAIVIRHIKRLNQIIAMVRLREALRVWISRK